MRSLNKEQVLFILALVILGGLAFLRAGDTVAPERTPKAQAKWEDKAHEHCAEIQFVNGDMEFYERKGRNIYAPPRDWLPLEPLVLDAPPQLELLVVGPFSQPALGEKLLAAYHHVPGPEPSPEEDAPEEEGEEAALGGDEEEGLTALSLELEDVEEEDPEAALAAVYDWIQLKEQINRIYGYIKNENKYQLLKNREPVVFEQVTRRTGKLMAAHEYSRDRIDVFGFADTVVNRCELAILDLSFNAGNLAAIHEKAEWCMSMREEDPAAIDYAVRLLEKAIELDPVSKDSYRMLADVHVMAFNREEAFKVLRSAMDRRLLAPAVYVRYGRLLRFYGMDDKALEAFDEAEKITPLYAESLMERARLLYDRGEYEEALRFFQQAEQSPSWKFDLKSEVLLGQGRCLLALGRLKEAALKIQRALTREENGEALNLKGAVALAQADLEGAEEAFQQALELDPERSAYLTNMGVVLFRKGDLQGAIQKFTEAIDLDPYFSCRPTCARGFIYELLGEEDSASSDYEMAVQIDPEDFYALYLWGRNLRKVGDMEGAISMLKKALQLKGTMVDILGELGHACLLAGRTEDAAFYFHEYLKRAEGDYRTQYLLGIAYLQQNRLDEAMKRFEAAQALAEELPDPFNGMAVALYGLGAVDEALDAFSQVIRSFEEDAIDPRLEYAARWQARIQEHRRKSQWLDGFQRKEIRANDWNLQQRCGPTVSIIGNELVMQGNQRQEQPDERTMIKRASEGKQFRIFEADLKAGEGNQARMGIFLGTYMPYARLGVQTLTEVGLAVDPNGNLVYNVVDKKDRKVEWERIKGVRLEPGESARLALEVTNYEDGKIRLIMDGESLLAEDLIVKGFKRTTREVQYGVFAQAQGSRRVHVVTDNVRVVVRH